MITELKASEVRVKKLLRIKPRNRFGENERVENVRCSSRATLVPVRAWVVNVSRKLFDSSGSSSSETML